MLIETADSGIQWTEPRDLSADDLQSAQADSMSPVQSPHMREEGYFYHETPSGVNVALADDSVHFLFAHSLRADKVKHLLTIGAFTEENIANSSDAWDDVELQPNWPHCIGLPVWIVAVGLLLYQAMRGRRRARERARQEIP